MFSPGGTQKISPNIVWLFPFRFIIGMDAWEIWMKDQINLSSNFWRRVSVVIGAWLLIGRLRTISWLVASALFVVLTLVSASLAPSGHSDCGCFGPVRVNPWITTCFNFTAILFLLFERPVCTQFSLVWSTVILVVPEKPSIPDFVRIGFIS